MMVDARLREINRAGNETGKEFSIWEIPYASICLPKKQPEIGDEYLVTDNDGQFHWFRVVGLIHYRK